MKRIGVIVVLLFLLVYSVQAALITGAVRNSIYDLVRGFCTHMETFSNSELESRESKYALDCLFRRFGPENSQECIVDEFSNDSCVRMTKYISHIKRLKNEKVLHVDYTIFDNDLFALEQPQYSGDIFKYTSVIVQKKITFGNKQFSEKHEIVIGMPSKANGNKYVIQHIRLAGANPVSAMDYWEEALVCYNDKDYEKALEYYRKSADMGYMPAMYDCAVMYLNKKGCRRMSGKVRYNNAVEYLKKLRNAGCNVNVEVPSYNSYFVIQAQLILTRLGEI